MLLSQYNLINPWHNLNTVYLLFFKKISLPECGRSGPPKSFTCWGLWAWLWYAPCSEPQILLGRSHATSLRCPPPIPSGRAEVVCDCSRLSIRKLFPEFPKPGKAGGEPAMFLLWTETILFRVTRTLESPLHQSQLTDTKFSFNPFLSDQANFIKLWGKQKFSALPLLGLHFATGLCRDWLRGSNVLLNSDKAGVLSRVAEGGSGSFIMSTSLLNDRHQRQWTAGQSLTCTKQSSPVVNSFLFSSASHCASYKPPEQFICNVLFSPVSFQKHRSVRVFSANHSKTGHVSANKYGFV